VTGRPIYLDHHATTPVDPRVASLVLEAMTNDFGNANSVDHAFGLKASGMVTKAATLVADLVDCEARNVRFTSGSTEAIRLAMDHLLDRHAGKTMRIALTRVEHKALVDAATAAARNAGAEVAWLDVDGHAQLDLDCLDRVLSMGVDVVCVMAANNEVGTIYPIGECAARAHSAGAAVLVDATQAAGRIPLSVQSHGIDYLALSAHKMYGPKGAGALITAEPATFDRAWHQGTPNVPGIVGLGEACRLRALEMAEDEARIGGLRDLLESGLVAQIPGLVVNGDHSMRLSSNLHVSIPGIPNDAVIGRLRETVAISTGAACVSGTHAPSHVLRAMGLSEDLQDSALRIGLGKFNTTQEIESAVGHITRAVDEIREIVSGAKHQ
jgi:cysteine desulfurase